MAMIDDLERLSALRDKGAISETEYDRAKERILDRGLSEDLVRASPSRGPLIRRSVRDRWLGGVCGGIARLTDSETWIWRLAFTAGLVFGGVTALLYVLLWIFVPPEDAPPIA